MQLRGKTAVHYKFCSAGPFALMFTKLLPAILPVSEHKKKGHKDPNPKEPDLLPTEKTLMLIQTHLDRRSYAKEEKNRVFLVPAGVSLRARFLSNAKEDSGGLPARLRSLLCILRLLSSSLQGVPLHP